MTIKAATEETLGALHAKVAKVMANVLDVYETSQEVYLKLAEAAENDVEVLANLPPAPEVSAPMLSAMTKFLNDNKISAEASAGETVSELAQKLQARQRRGRSVGNVVHLDEQV